MEGIRLGLIGGTGLTAMLNDMGAGHARRHEKHTPFGKPSDVIIETELAGVTVLLLGRHGPGHLLGPSSIPYRANIFALKELGCTHIIASGAVGSLREEFRPRELVVPDQIIDKTYRRAGTFFEHAAVHVEFAEPFCPVLRQVLIEAGTALAADEGGLASGEKREQIVVHDRGCYVAMEGPAFSTRAESLMNRLWGGDLIGMTAMPEAKLAREAEISYALVALVTDYDCWRNKNAAGGSAEKGAAGAGVQAGAAAGGAGVGGDILLAEITANVRQASANAMQVIRRAIELMAAKDLEVLASPAHRALARAIWSEKTAIPPQEVNRLAPLWMKYFEPPR
jgi:5'-methylthioadenosine phosphorylase